MEWIAIYNGDCRDPATGMRHPNPGQWCGHPHGYEGGLCWLPYTIDDTGCTPAAKDDMGQFKQHGEYDWVKGGATTKLGLWDPYKEEMITQSSEL